MATSLAPILEDQLEGQLEDPLAYLPHTNIAMYGKGRIVYDASQFSAGLYLIVSGKVTISRFSHSHQEVVIDIYGRDEFFGESAFLSMPRRGERAMVLEDAKLMLWQASALQEMVVNRPRLAVAFLQILVQRTALFKERLESLSVDSTGRRVASALIRLAHRLGTARADGAVCMLPLTHELLSQYTGTTREIVTLHMNRFRRLGYVQYSRKAIALYPDALNEWVRQNP
jgi:CRP-like cAMP-binding protein